MKHMVLHEREQPHFPNERHSISFPSVWAQEYLVLLEMNREDHGMEYGVLGDTENLGKYQTIQKHMTFQLRLFHDISCGKSNLILSIYVQYTRKLVFRFSLPITSWDVNRRRPQKWRYRRENVMR